MPFTTQDFFKSAAQAKKVPPRQPSYFPGDDEYLEQSSAVSLPLSSIPSLVLFSMGLSLLSLGPDQHADCRRSCRHVSCRTFRPAHDDMLPDSEPRRASCLNYGLVIHIFFLHKKLQSIQDSTEATQKMIDVCLTDSWDFNPVRVREYVRDGRRRCKEFEDLLTDIRDKNAYFGHINMPDISDHLLFYKAVYTSGLSKDRISLEQLLRWQDVAERLRKESRTNCEWIFEHNDYYQLQGVWFKPGWSFESAYARGGASAADMEEIAPDEKAPGRRGIKRAPSQSSDVSDEKVAKMKTSEELFANY